MKRRIRKIVNFFAFNLLFFALYLNFIHSDNAATADIPAEYNASAFTGTVLVENPAEYLKQQSEGASVNVVPQPAIRNEEKNTPSLKLSIN